MEDHGSLCLFQREAEWRYFDFDWFQRRRPDTTETVVNKPTVPGSFGHTSVEHEMDRCPPGDRFDHFTELLQIRI
jgi:hypothetical protein